MARHPSRTPATTQAGSAPFRTAHGPFLGPLHRDARGGNLVEYLIVLGLIAIVALVGVKKLGASVSSKAGQQADCVATMSCKGGENDHDGKPPAPKPKPVLEVVLTGDESPHVGVEVPTGLTRASVDVIVDRTAGKGLNFFALQVNFDNGTWAHGGLQDLDGSGDARHLVVNWGGLVDLGGGSADYDIGDAAQQAKALDKIQNPRDGKQVEDVSWSRDTRYTLSIERGALHHFEAGDYVLTQGQPATHVDHPRDLYEWTFTARPTGGGDPIYQGVLYDSASTLNGFTYWNESGYGSTNDDLQATWSNPSYRTEAHPSEDQRPKSVYRY